MVRLSYLGSGYVFCFGAPIHMPIYNDTYAVLHKSLDPVRSSIRIPTSVYIYLQVKLVTLNNTIIFVHTVPDIHLLMVASSTVASS